MGIEDVEEDGATNADQDGDGIPNSLDLDSDNDGILDIVEAGHGASDPDGDGMVDPNTVGFNGLSDPLETAPESGETNYVNASPTTDPLDSDGDNVPDYLDLDSDNDNVPDLYESGIPNPESLDPDSNGTIDFVDEPTSDPDKDGILVGVDGDPNDRGDANSPALPDEDAGNDPDNAPDYLDVDNDITGVDTIDETTNSPLDTDNDGRVDGGDPEDVDDDGIIDDVDDSDGDGLVDSDPGENDPQSFGGLGAPTVMICGDSVVTDASQGGIEICDDGNTTDGDGCSASCALETGFICVDDPEAGPCPNGGPGTVEAACGNNEINNGEQCDDANDQSGDGCSSTCQIESGYVCDSDANDNPCGTTDAGSVVTVCGDDIVAGSEICDDGNTADGDGCSSTCAIESGYICENGSDADGPCPAGLVGQGHVVENCGDGVITPSEQCDDANTADGDGCSSACSIEPTWSCMDEPSVCQPDCSNGIMNPGEQCDDGNLVDGDGCDSVCGVEDGWSCLVDSPANGVCDTAGPGSVVTVCGNGEVAPSVEDCDDGNSTDGDGCSSNCTIESGFACDQGPAAGPCESGGAGSVVPLPACGDGSIDANEGEICDDQNTDNGDGCSSICQVEDMWTCTGEPSICEQIDTDSDGIPDVDDVDDDNDGITDVIENFYALNGGDTDGDGIPDSLDLDADNDGILDVTEAGSPDTNGDGMVDPSGDGNSDDDGDGLIDTADPEDLANGAPGIPAPRPDTDGDGVYDYLDLDSDNDSLSDLLESDSGCLDVSPNNGVCDSPDSDLDGIVDDIDQNNDPADPKAGFGDTGHPAPPNSDNEGLPDYRDPHNDDTGVDDIDTTLNSPLDADNDGEIDDEIDNDGDGIMDVVDDSDNDGTPDVDPNETDPQSFGGLTTPTLCGNGFMDAGETCDDGNVSDNDGCSAACELESGYVCVSGPSAGPCTTAGPDTVTGVCGDGILVDDESCDDGNTTSGDGCSSDCTVEDGFDCVGDPSVCNSSCGDGTVAGSENCDDGNTDSGDGCSSLCEIESGYVCITGPAAGPCETVTPNVQTVCDDGTVAGDEICDDGNTADNDGCSASCALEVGYVCVSGPEAGPCTTGGNASVEPKCGDSIVVGNEFCDDGNVVSGDGCSATCMIEDGYICVNGPTAGPCTPTGNVQTVCGDGTIAGDEDCDDSNTASGDGCSATCEVETGFTCVGEPSNCASNCGDGAITGSEACDDGNAVDGDGCTACVIDSGYSCVNEPSECSSSCGDGTIAGAEVCDDGNAVDGDGCSSSCVVESGYDCVNEPSECTANCGDGLITGSEACDDGNATDDDGCTGCVVDDRYICTGEASVCEIDTDGDGVTDNIDVDDDNDGIPDTIENFQATNGGDTDGDGTPDSLDLDSDNDGIPDVIEGGSPDTDGDGTVDPSGDGNNDDDGDGLIDTADPEDLANGVPGTPAPTPDTDGDGADDYIDLDADNDGKSDLVEGGQGCTDANNNGVCDGPDTDEDGIVNSIDPVDGHGGDVTLPLPDKDAGNDPDMAPDFLDLDNDTTGIDDIDTTAHGPLDQNDDGELDDPTDNDGDGIADVIDDSDLDGTPDNNDPDPQAFGGLQGPGNCGNGTITNPEACDDGNTADGDGCSSTCEVEANWVCTGEPSTCVLDTDGDGVPDVDDVDDDNDGIPDTIENFQAAPGGDTDGDGTPDSLDLDSDNDGIPDVIEGGSPDTDGDGMVDPSGDGNNDDDGDGLIDTADPEDLANGVPGTSAPTPDTDNDGQDDYIDLDSDNDGLTDLAEGGQGCADGDDNGVCDGPDTDGDGLADSIDPVDGHGGDITLPLPDKDAGNDPDNAPDYLDVDNGRHRCRRH